MTTKLWSGRFNKATHPDVEKFTASILFDHELAYEDILGSLVHAKMLNHCSLINADEYAQIEQGLKQIAHEIRAGKVVLQIADEDIHMNIERLLYETIGPVAGKLHTARSRNDQVALDTHLYLRKKIVVISDLLLQLQMTLITIAKLHHKTILPGYTHSQRAQPIYLSQHLLAYVSMFQRDFSRLQENWMRVNQSPLGACALAGTTLPTDKQWIADQLKFDGVYLNTLDAVSDRDYIIEFIANAALISMHISRFSEELVLWSSQEFNFISFDESFCTGSSIMPQKKNPDVVELGRGKTSRVYGALITLLTLLKGLPLAYNKDLQEDKQPLFDTVKTLQEVLAIYLPLLSTMTIHTDVMRQAANDGYLNATVLAEYLVKQGLPFREAHEVTGKMVAYCITKQCHLEDLTSEELNKFSPLILENIKEVLAIENTMIAYTTNGPLQLASYEKHVQQNQTWIKEKHQLLNSIATSFHLPETIYS